MKYHKFYPILDSSNLLSNAVILGVKFVQLRLKNVSIKKIEEEIFLSKKICLQNNAQLIVNDYWEEALKQGCDFVHLGQEDLYSRDGQRGNEI